MDVNLHAEVKGYGAPAMPSPEQEGRNRSRVAPVEQSRDSSQSGVDERLLARREPFQEKENTELSREKVAEYVDAIQQRFDSMGNKLNFALDEESESVVIRVTDRESGELVRQIPPESVIDLKMKLDDLVGILFDQQV